MTISLLPALVATSGSLESAGAPKWNAQAGVWEGDRAAGSVDIPSPLWIFGYGSLCWRADFPAAESFVGRVQGWRRFFAQSSADHRGTPESPGLVATLISDPQLEAIGLRHADEEPSTTCGVCYRVAEEEARWPFSCELLCTPVTALIDLAHAHVIDTLREPISIRISTKSPPTDLRACFA